MEVEYVVYIGLALTFTIGLIAEYQNYKRKKLRAIEMQPRK